MASAKFRFVPDLRQVLALVWADADAYVRARLIGVLALVIAAGLSNAFGPVALKRIVDGLSGHASATAIGIYVFVALYVLSQWFSRSAGEVRGFIHAKAERRMFRVLSERVFDHLMRLPMRFHAERRTGAINQTLENGLQGYQIIMHHMVFTCLPVLVELGTIIVILTHFGHPTFLMLFCAALICYAATFTCSARIVGRNAERASAAAVESTAAIIDPVLNIEAVKHFAIEETMRERVVAALARTETEWIRFFRLYAGAGLIVGTLFALFLAATVTYSTRETIAGRMTLGEFVLANTYMLQLARPVEMMGYAMQGISQGAGMLGKLLALLAEAPEAYLPDDRGSLAGPGRIDFINVCASYRASHAVLRDATFSVEAGKTVAIVGASGSGKSTIVRLLVRTLETERGRILFDGVPAEAIPLSKLRRSIGIVAQDTTLFDTTIGENIAIGWPQASRAQIEQAARAARLHDFIMRLPEGYETQVGERGVKLSGGERQRVAIARVILKNPLIYVFDEATSALDVIDERMILTNIFEMSTSRTTIVIAHRLSTVVHADTIIVLDQGSIVERGTHSELIGQGGRYAALWRTQQRSLRARDAVKLIDASRLP